MTIRLAKTPKTMRTCCALGIALSFLVCATGSKSGTLTVGGFAGIVNSDLGGESKTGPMVGIATLSALGNSGFELVSSCKYVVRGGEATVGYVDAGEGLPVYLGQGVLSLGYVQPTIEIRKDVCAAPVSVAISVGLGAAFLVHKELTDPEAPVAVWGHLGQVRDTDLLGVLGVEVHGGNFGLGVHAEYGLANVFEAPQRAGEFSVFEDLSAKNKSMDLYLSILF